MKKFFVIASAAIICAACAKEAPEVSSNGISAPFENAEQVAVMFNSNVVASVQTKAQGGVDAWNGAQNLKIFGYQRQTEAIDYSTAVPFIENVSAVSPVEGAGDNVIAVLDADQKPFYYVGNFTYDFYGYYIDDIDAQVVKTPEGIYVPLELTGGEDIMLAQASPEADVLKAKDAGVFTGDDTWNDRYAYSAYAARRGVQPTLTFQHQLVRFTFAIESGSEFATTGDPDKNLFVTGVTMNARNKADLFIAGQTKGLVNINEELVTLSLCSRNAEGVLTDMEVYEVPDKNVAITEGENVLGESLMVIPNAAPAEGQTDTYKMDLLMRQAGKDIPYPVELKFSSVKNAPADQTQFTPGYSYRITIKVYSLEDVEISAELEPWAAGGDISIDTDDAPEIL